MKARDNKLFCKQENKQSLLSNGFFHVTGVSMV